jgi:hypothetical protein
MPVSPRPVRASPESGRAGSISPPTLVAVGLWGIRTRGAAFCYLWACVGLAVVCVPAAFIFSLDFALGVPGGAIAALLYRRSIKWADENDYWP